MNALVKKAVGCTVIALACLRGAAVAGPVDGDQDWDIEIVDAYSTDYYDVYLTGGEVTHVLVQGDGDTDLDVYVFDENGNLVVSGMTYTDYEYVSFIPSSTGWYRIEVKNLGAVYCRYRIDIW